MKDDNWAEQAAELVTVEGWACKKCGRWWGADERMARYCCASSFPCECGKNRHQKGRVKCDDCLKKEALDRWNGKEAIAWDGEFPIADWQTNQYFFDEDSLIEYIAEANYEAGEKLPLNSFWLTTCRPKNGRPFVMNEYLCDDLMFDDSEAELDEDAINKAVNDWIESHAPFAWEMTGKRLDSESVERKVTKVI